MRDFDRADAVPMKRCSGSSTGRENSPSTNPEMRVEERNPSFAELKRCKGPHGEGDRIKEETEAEEDKIIPAVSNHRQVLGEPRIMKSSFKLWR